MRAYIFPGQGSQAKGMGSELFDEFPDIVKICDNFLGYSIKTLCLEDPQQQLNQTQFTQPALYTVNALTYYKKLKSAGTQPDFVAGHSLGEYNALLAAGVFDFNTGLKLVKKRGELMSQAQNGGMAAILGMNAEQVQEILNQHQLTITIANQNSYLQNVISGTREEIDKAKSIFNNLQTATYIPLKVSGAFHSPLMQTAAEQFKAFLREFTFNMPHMPVLANVNARAYHPLIAKDNLIKQITHPVRWTEIIEYFLACKDAHIEEIGPGSVLKGILAKMRAGE